MLKINNVSKSYGNIKVLNNINLEIKKNQIIGLAGPSGSGKSTLLRCIQKLEAIDSGNIKCNGETGFMFQDFQLFPHMKVLKNLTYAPSLNKNNKIQNLENKALKLLENLGIKNKANSYPHEISGGQKQRVALARSLMMNPSLLLCDEPTSGLDLVTISDIIKLINSIKSMGITMIIASHNLDFIIEVSNKIILIKNAEIVVNINPKDIKNPVELLKKHY